MAASLDAYSEIISFQLGQQEFCVDIMAIKEIRGWAKSTSLPHAPAHVLGVINLRGSVIPVIDMAARLGLPQIEPTERSAIIVAEISGKLAGLLVENVSDMITIETASIQPTPDVLNDIDRAVLRGVVPLEEQLICFLDLDVLFPKEMLDEAA